MGVMIEGFALDGRTHEALITYNNENNPIIVVLTAKSYDDKEVKVYNLICLPANEGNESEASDP